MTAETAWNLQQGLINLGLSRYRLIWHGGEPLLRGIKFYQEVMEQQMLLREKHPNLIILNGIQSNLTRLTPEWCEFLKDNNFSVGTSLDGWQELHDQHRKYRDGTGMFEDAQRGFLLAQKYGLIGGFIAVVTQGSLKQDPRKYTEWLIGQGVPAEVSPCWEMPGVDGESPNYVVSPEQLLPFLQEMFDYWWEGNDPQRRVRIFHGFMQALLGGKEMTCEFKGNCGDFLAMDSDGSIYPCGKFAGLPGFKLGNVNEQPLSEILECAAYKSFLALRVDLPSRCQVCKWSKVCNNGCSYERYLGNGQFAEYTPFCQTWNGMYEYVEGKIKTLQSALAERK
jgi:uncharacterized protein